MPAARKIWLYHQKSWRKGTIDKCKGTIDKKTVVLDNGCVVNNVSEKHVMPQKHNGRRAFVSKQEHVPTNDKLQNCCD